MRKTNTFNKNISELILFYSHVEKVFCCSKNKIQSLIPLNYTLAVFLDKREKRRNCLLLLIAKKIIYTFLFSNYNIITSSLVG